MKTWNKKRRTHQPFWILLDTKYGRMLSYGSKRHEDERFIRYIWRFKNKPRWSGRQSYDHQPKQFIKCGWYYEYMKEEWSESTGHRRRHWLDRMIRRQERLAHSNKS